MTVKVKVGEFGVDSMIAGLSYVSNALAKEDQQAYPARIDESVRFPLLSEVKKT